MNGKLYKVHRCQCSYSLGNKSLELFTLPENPRYTYKAVMVWAIIFILPTNISRKKKSPLLTNKMFIPATLFFGTYLKLVVKREK